MTSPPMSIAIRTIALPRRRTRDFSGAGARMYGRVARTSSAGTGSTGSAGLWRTGRSTCRSYLAGHRDHRIRPVLERMAFHHPPPQLFADGGTLRRPGPGHGADRGSQCRRVAVAGDQLERQPAEELRKCGTGRDDWPRAGGRFEDCLVERQTGAGLVRTYDHVRGREQRRHVGARNRLVQLGPQPLGVDPLPELLTMRPLVPTERRAVDVEPHVVEERQRVKERCEALPPCSAPQREQPQGTVVRLERLGAELLDVDRVT